MPYNHLRTLTFHSNIELEHFKSSQPADPPPVWTARSATASADALARVVFAKVAVRSVEVAGRLSRGGGAHIGSGGRVGGCVARRARKACKDDGQGRGVGRGEGLQGLSAGPGGWWARIDPWLGQGPPWSTVVRPWSWAGGLPGAKIGHSWLAGGPGGWWSVECR